MAVLKGTQSVMEGRVKRIDNSIFDFKLRKASLHSRVYQLRDKQVR